MEQWKRYTTEVGTIRGVKLAKCPFCGNDKHFHVVDPSCEGMDGDSAVWCEVCLTTGPRVRFRMRAVKAWNNRTDFNAPPDRGGDGR